jgi:hypothetical protein
MLVRNLLKKFPQKAATLQALVAKNFARGKNKFIIGLKKNKSREKKK